MKNKILTALLSLGIALSIWLYVVTVVSPNSDKHYENIPVVTQSEVLLHERGLMITEKDVSEVTLHLEGSRIDLNKLNSSNINVTVDVSKIYEPGIHNLTYSVSYPGDVAQNAINVRSKTPGTVTVKVEERINKKIPVDVQYVGSVAQNFMADKENKQLDVEAVTITGPKSVVDQITVAQIQLDLEGLSESISEQFTYTLCNSKGEPVDAALVITDVAKINLTLRIMRVKEIELRVNVIDGGGITAQSGVVAVNPKTIWVSGSDTLLEKLEYLEIGTVNVAEIEEDTSLTFPIKLPDGITDETGVTEATVDVQLPELATKTLTITDIEAINVPENVSISLLTKALEIKIRGPESKIDSIEASAFTATVDFTGTELGTVKVRAQITCTDAEVGAVGVYTVSATVR